MDRSPRLSPGDELGPYEILASLGAGGMGEVYRARDPRLEREVALKVLPTEMADDPERLARFEREAKALAALNHPHIVTVHSVEEADGVRFLTMELVDGDTLDELIPADGLDLDRFLELAVPLADAVATAHSRGVVHRDLKPANVMVTSEGRVKVLDFGLARREVSGDEQGVASLPTETLEKVTREGQVVGTVPYMAPEQLQGRPTSPQTDIFSLGVILYEMLTGSRPFHGQSGADLISSILRDLPPQLAELRPRLPRELSRLVTRCLEKEAERRIQTALDVRNELEEIRDRLAQRRSKKEREDAVGDAPSVAVLPFVNMNRDEESEFFADGLTEEILNALTRVEGLRVASRTSVFRYKTSSADVREIARELKVSTVLEGSVRRLGDRIRVTAQLIEAEDGLHRWSRRYDRRLEDVFEVQDDVARSVADELKGELVGTTDRVVGRPTESSEAYDLYLKGRYQWERMTPEGFEAAIRYFERSITADPEFALPRAWLSVAYHYLCMFGYVPVSAIRDRCRQEMEKAVALEPDLAEAHEARGLYLQYYEWDWEGTERAYRKAMDLRPGDVTARAWYAIFLVRFPDRQDEAIAALERALEMDPVSFETVTFHLYVLIHTRRAEEAGEAIERPVELYPGVPLAYWATGGLLIELERFDDAAGVLEKGLEVAPGDPLCAASLVVALARAGERARAREVLSTLLDRRRAAYCPGAAIAIGLAGLGEVDESLDWLEIAFEEREPILTFCGVWPVFDRLHGERRFQEVLRQMGLEQQPGR